VAKLTIMFILKNSDPYIPKYIIYILLNIYGRIFNVQLCQYVLYLIICFLALIVFYKIKPTYYHTDKKIAFFSRFYNVVFNWSIILVNIYYAEYIIFIMHLWFTPSFYRFKNSNQYQRTVLNI